MKRLRLISALTLVTVLTAGATMSMTPDAASAQESPPPPSDTISVSPPVDELSANPGDTVKRKITITNATSRTRRFATSTKNAIPTGNEGAPSLVPDEGPYALASWLSLNPQSISIEAGESADFEVTINVPQDAGPGSHSGAVVFTPSADPTAGGAAVSVVAEVSALLLVNVSGDIKNDVKLQSFDSEKGFYQSGPVKFTAIFKNDGNLVARPQGTVTVKNLFNRTVATLKIEPQRVLPTAERKFEVTWDQKNLLGPYTAEVAWHAESVSAQPTEVRVWGAPLVKIVIGLGVLALLFLIFWLPRKRWAKAARALRSKD